MTDPTRDSLPPTQPTPVTPRQPDSPPKARPKQMPPPVVTPAWLPPAPVPRPVAAPPDSPKGGEKSAVSPAAGLEGPTPVPIGFRPENTPLDPPAAGGRYRSLPNSERAGVGVASRWLTYLSLGALTMALVLLLAAVSGGAIWFYHSDIILPGVYVNDIPVGGLTRTEAVSRLEARWPSSTITLAGKPNDYPVEAAALGLRLDGTATADIAHAQGRSWVTLTEMLQNGSLKLTPVVAFEPTAAEQTLQQKASLFEVPPVDADIHFTGSRVEAVPAVDGQRLDVPATVSHISQDPALVLRQGRLPLTLVAVEPALTDVSGVVAEANALLSNTIAIDAYDPINDETISLSLEPAVWGEWLTLALEVDDPTRLAWQVDEAQVEAYVTEQMTALSDNRTLDPAEAVAVVTTALKEQRWTGRLRVYHGERQHTVQYGETLSSIGYDYGIPYPWIEAANPGLEALSPGQIITIPSPDGLLPLPVVEDKRIVVSLSEQKTWVYEDGALKWEWSASTGIPSSPTAPGVFQIQSQEVDAYAASWNLWMPHFLGIYRPVPTADFMNGFHGFPTRNGSTLLWTDDLGHPVTYGCILVSSDNAAQLFEWAEAGVVVEIRR